MRKKGPPRAEGDAGMGLSHPGRSPLCYAELTRESRLFCSPTAVKRRLLAPGILGRVAARRVLKNPRIQTSQLVALVVDSVHRLE